MDELISVTRVASCRVCRELSIGGCEDGRGRLIDSRDDFAQPPQTIRRTARGRIDFLDLLPMSFVASCVGWRGL